MRSFGIGLGLLASAFSPLLVALVLVTRPLPGWWWDAALALLFALPVLLLLSVRRAIASLGGAPLDVRTATPRDSDVLTFIASYLVPIAIVFFVVPDLPRIAAMLVLLTLLIAVYVRAELFWLNPFLPLAGFRVYQVVTEGGTTVMLVTRRREIVNGSRLTDVREFASSIRIDLEGRS